MAKLGMLRLLCKYGSVGDVTTLEMWLHWKFDSVGNDVASPEDLANLGLLWVSWICCDKVTDTVATSGNEANLDMGLIWECCV